MYAACATAIRIDKLQLNVINMQIKQCFVRVRNVVERA